MNMINNLENDYIIKFNGAFSISIKVMALSICLIFFYKRVQKEKP